MEMDDRCEKTAYFLEDEPCHDSSAFQIHEEIARAIASEIKTGEPGNIALVGNWGSGKSTIVDRVEGLIQSADGSFVKNGEEPASVGDGFIYFKFDAWAHSGDSLRRNFLTSLADELKRHRVLSEKEKEGIDDRIHGRTSSSTIKEDASFAPPVAASIIATAVYALVVAILSSAKPLGRLFFTEVLSLDIDPLWRAVLNCVPLVCAVLAFAWVRCKLRQDDTSCEKREKGIRGLWHCAVCAVRRGGGEDKPEHSKQSVKMLTDIFSRNTDTTTVSKRNNSPILDSLAFEKIYMELAGSTKKTIVVVFDNLDRLDCEGLRDAWGTLQIFANCFDQVSGGRRSLQAQMRNKDSFRPWILLPVSGEAFQMMDEFGANSEGVSIAKLFIRVFEIPTLITTDWRGYFLLQAQKAFPDSDEEELSTVYAIASRTLLRIEGRTPRNAKRFINSMVAQVRVFPGVCLASIAAYCLMKDSYALATRGGSGTSGEMDDETDIAKGGMRSFAEFATEVIAGSHELSPYIESFSDCSDDLLGDLAMMAYGQFSRESASEVFVISRIRSVLEGRARADICSVVQGNEGSWSLITTEVKDGLLGVGRDETPSWVYEMLQSLNDRSSGYYEKDSVERDHLASVLIASIGNMRTGFGGCSESISEFVSRCPESTVSNLLAVVDDALSHNLNELLALEDVDLEETAIDENRAEEARTLFLKAAEDAAPILEASYNDVSAARSMVHTILDNLCLGSHYADFIVRCSERTRTAKWLEGRPPKNSVEFFSLLDIAKERVCHGVFDDPTLAVIKEDRFLSRMEFDYGAVEKLVDLHNDSAPGEEPTNELLIACWLLSNVCNIDVAPLLSLLKKFDVPANGFELCSSPDHPYKNAAILALVVDMASSGCEGVEDLEETFYTSLIDERSIAVLKECNEDVLSQAVGVAKDACSRVAPAAKKLAQLLWSEDDFAGRGIETCFQFVSLSTNAESRIEHGRMLGCRGRAIDLMEETFSYYWASVYLGVLEALVGEERVEYLAWLEAGIGGMDSADWSKALGITQIERLRAIMEQLPHNRKLPSLDQALQKLLCDEFPGAKKLETACEMMSVYRFDSEGLVRSLIEANDLVVRHFAAYAPVLKRCKWLEALSPSQRYENVVGLVKGRKAAKCAALVELLGSADNPKRLFTGNLVKTRAIIEYQSGLKTMPKAGKEACATMIELLK